MPRGTAAMSVARRKDIASDTIGISRTLEEEERDRVRFRTAEQKQFWLEKFDKNQSGTFDREEFGTLVHSVMRDAYFSAPAYGAGTRLLTTAEEASFTLPDRMLDKEFAGKETLDADEGYAAVQRVLQYVQARQKLRAMFEDADANGDGQLNCAELKDLLQKGAPGWYVVTNEDCEFVTRKCDVDGDGMISLEELGPALAVWMDIAEALPAMPELQHPPLPSITCVLL